MAVGRLTRRAQFLACAASGRKVALPGMVVQGLVQPASDCNTPPLRVGFTVTKRVGNAVVRNRVRRRLREVVRLAFAEAVPPSGHDLVVIGREGTIRRDFGMLRQDFGRALAKLDMTTQTRA